MNKSVLAVLMGLCVVTAVAEPLKIIGFETGAGITFEGATVSNYYTIEFATVPGRPLLSQDGVSLTLAKRDMQVFDTNGTFTVPAGVTRIMVEVWGGGGGGGAADHDRDTQGGGGTQPVGWPGGDGASGRAIVYY